MTGVEKRRPMPQLDRAIAARRRQPSPSTEQVDVPRPCDVEAMPVRADERALRFNEVEAADWAT